MGQRGPLDHPELREIENLLDLRDVAQAQRLLAEIGNRKELSDAIAYLTTRLLHARGRLDLPGVADRLRDLIAKSPDFPEARALLANAEQGRISAPPPTPKVSISNPMSHAVTAPDMQSPASVRPSEPAPDEESRRSPSGKPRTLSPPPAGGPSGHGGPAVTVPASPQAPRPWLEESREPGAGRRHPTPRWDPSEPPPRGSAPPERRVQAYESEPPPQSEVPIIPRAGRLPYFKDNSAPPSYAPSDRTESSVEVDVIHSKSLLPQNAGRYSQTPAAADVVESRGRPSRMPRPSQAPGGAAHRGRQTVPQTPHRIRSGHPPQSPLPLPTLFEIASWIDEGRHRDAIAAINRAGPGVGPEYAVLRARALAGEGYVDQAVDALEKLEAQPSLDAELRAACARLFVDLGDPARALRLARRAYDAEPERPLIRITYALAAIRTSRRTPDDSLLVQAERALERLQGREGPLPGLYQALRACVEAGVGDPERAISMAQRALGLDSKSPDALAAIAEASARLGRAHDARQAWSKLREISPAEGDALASVVAHAGVPVSPHPDPDERTPEVPFWDPVEMELVSGRRADALRVVEQAAQDTLKRMSKTASQSGLTPIATVAASFLTLAPVLSSFAPFDMSLWSVRRVETGLDILYGADRRPRLPSDDSGLVLLLGSYLGETLRLAHGGNWEGRIADLDAARIVTKEGQWYPFRIVTARLHQGRRAPIGEALASALSKPNTEAWQTRIANPVAPKVPWAPRTWPQPSQIASLGRSLTRSPIGKFCEDIAEGPLDRTTASLIALDTYLDLVAPPRAPADTDTTWARRIAVLAGGYVGETLRELVGGEWVHIGDEADNALAFKLKLRGTIEAMPVAHVHERMIGERSWTLVDYAKTLMRRAGRG